MSDAGEPPNIGVFRPFARFAIESIGTCALQQCLLLPGPQPLQAVRFTSQLGFKP
jgi:hypothetical protein